MDAVPATHKGNRLVGGEHVFTTDWTITFRTLLDALVRGFSLDRHAGSTCLAVEEVLSLPFA